MMGPASEIAADKLERFNEVMGWVHDYVKEGKFAAGTGKNFFQTFTIDSKVF